MKKYSKKKKTIHIMYALILFLSIGYAVFSVTLKTNGFFGIHNANVNVIWDNPEIKSGSIDGDVSIDTETKTMASFTANFNNPGDYCMFTIDTKNMSNTDVMIDSIDVKAYSYKNGNRVLTSLPEYIKYNLSYADGVKVYPYQLLEKNSTEKVFFKVSFDKNISVNELPTTTSSIEIEFSINYKYPNKNSYKRATGNSLKSGNDINNTMINLIYQGNIEEFSDDDISDCIDNNTHGYFANETISPYLEYVSSATTEQYNAVKDTLTDDNIISLSTKKPSKNMHPFATGVAIDNNDLDSSTPVYMWYKKSNKTIYYYSEADKINLNSDSSSMFWGFMNLKKIDLSKFNTIEVRDMSYMFRACTEIEELDVSGFDTRNVTNMRGVFSTATLNGEYGFSLMNLDLSKWDTSKVTDMSEMFARAKFKTIDLSNFDTSKVTDMTRMFCHCTSLTKLKVNGWDTSEVISMSYMFKETGLTTLDISSFDTSKVININDMFAYNENLTTIYVGDNWSTISVDLRNSDLFCQTYNIVGGNGTTYIGDSLIYAKIDEDGSPGYFTYERKKNKIIIVYNILVRSII